MSLLALTLTASVVTSSVSAEARAERLAKLLIESHRLTADSIAMARAARKDEANCREALAEELAKPPVVAEAPSDGFDLSTVFVVGLGGLVIGAIVGGSLVAVASK